MGSGTRDRGTVSPRARGQGQVPLFLYLVMMFNNIFESVYGIGPGHRADTGPSVGERP